jgi:heme/copper-type cytochrome/quinol oxidase subunit 1
MEEIKLKSVSFVFLFTIGGFSGLMLGIAPADIQYHDTYFVPSQGRALAGLPLRIQSITM